MGLGRGAPQAEGRTSWVGARGECGCCTHGNAYMCGTWRGVCLLCGGGIVGHDDYEIYSLADFYCPLLAKGIYPTRFSGPSLALRSSKLEAPQ